MAVPWVVLTVPRGDSYLLELRFVDDDDEPEVLDAGLSWQAQYRVSFDAEDAVDFGVTADRAAGIVRLTLTDEQTRSLSGGLWGLREISEAEGTTVTLLQGELVVGDTVVR